MTIEKSIQDVIQSKLEDGLVERLVSEQLEKGITKALESLFGSYGDVTKIIEKQIKSVMVPYLEAYDYSEYIVKLDDVLVEVLKNTTIDNKDMLNNFKELMSIDEKVKEIKLTDLFSKWTKYVAKNVDTSDLEVCYEDGVSYENVEVRFNVDYNEEHSWSSFEHAVLTFECEQDEKMNYAIRLSRWKNGRDKGWDITYDKVNDLKSLKDINQFEILLMKLKQNYTTLVIDEDCDSDYIQPEVEPEATFS
ncbi:hypothetical protein BSK59_13585 [Paenibacillus odorifer]|uniref:hypothetical protein n=1 Tax=Paenibacillus odorifer TaxID=189426 RepID=UPI00096FD470|nr:hypothetical protein [Paenibacillus odorifer]OME55503.1 hypothetical protein BSK59_13585 [Paenibacillus odorifer]